MSIQEIRCCNGTIEIRHEQQQEYRNRIEELRKRYTPDEFAELMQHVEDTPAIATLTDNELCDVLLASYVPLAERMPQTWQR